MFILYIVTNTQLGVNMWQISMNKYHQNAMVKMMFYKQDWLMNELLYLQAKMGDSMSCMSLSISLRKSTVISRFPLTNGSRNLMSASHTHFFSTMPIHDTKTKHNWSQFFYNFWSLTWNHKWTMPNDKTINTNVHHTISNVAGLETNPRPLVGLTTAITTCLSGPQNGNPVKKPLKIWLSYKLHRTSSSGFLF